MSTNQNPRTYTLDEASKELNINRETLERLLPHLDSGSQRTGSHITEDELNRIVDLMNSDGTLAPDAPKG